MRPARRTVGVFLIGAAFGFAAGFLAELWGNTSPVVVAIDPTNVTGPLVQELGGGYGGEPLDGRSTMGLPGLRFMQLTTARNAAPVRLEVETRNSQNDGIGVLLTIKDNGEVVGHEHRSFVRAGESRTRTFEWNPKTTGRHTLTVETYNRDGVTWSRDFGVPLIDDGTLVSRGIDRSLVIAASLYGGVLALIGRSIVLARRRVRPLVAAPA